MEQRSLRLGDTVDDYCPRERRVTNHAVVALVGDTIKQTRCSTCETEHEYKEGRAPKRRGPKGDGNGHAPEPQLRAVAEAATATLAGPPQNHQAAGPAGAPAPPAPAAAEPEAEPALADEPLHDGWLAHRPLIRASLPRTNEEPQPRAIPEFTMHQRPGRGFGGRGFRHGHPGYGGNGNANGNSQGNAGGHSFDGEGPDGNRTGRPGRSRHRRRHRRPR